MQNSLGATCLCCDSGQSVVSSGQRLVFSGAWRRQLQQQRPGKPYCVSCTAMLVSRCSVWLCTFRALPTSLHSAAAGLHRTQPQQQLCRAEARAPAGAFDRGGRDSATRQQLFNRIAPAYDQLNDVLSLGLHRVWKRAAVKWSGAAEGQTALDVCCGSGDLALRLAQAVGIDGKVVGLDFAQEMLDDASRRDAELPAYWDRAPIDWVQGDALQLPFDDSSFDAATVGFGLRNVTDVPQALRELQRVLRPGAKAAILDFNNSDAPATDSFQGWALQNVVVPAASLYGMQDEYAYLRPSIKRFATGPQQEQLALEAGFEQAQHYELAFGLMGCLVAIKRS